MLVIPGVEVDERRLADICGRYGIAELKIFGSRARRTADSQLRQAIVEAGQVPTERH